jgi:hypothetical protein
MAFRVDGPVGLRGGTLPVKNKKSDQETVINLLEGIPVAQGGKKESWPDKPAAGPDGNCPKALAKAIWDFQKFWKAEGVFHNIDSVVDPNMNTIKKMNELYSPGGETPPAPQPPPPPAAPKNDIIVFFEGHEEDRDLTAEEVFPGSLLNGETPHRFGHRGYKIRDEAANMVSDIAGRVKKVRTELSRIFIYGLSAGGRNALALAAQLIKDGIAIRYLAISNTAWFPNETKTLPGEEADVNPVPDFAANPLPTCPREEWFETVGNHSTKTWFHGRLFTSSMDKQEIHLHTMGFAPSNDITEEVKRTNPANDMRAHVACNNIARPRMQNRISSILHGD